MSGDKRARLKEWLQSGTVRLQPLTLPQRELWEAAPVPVGDVSNHICCLIKVRGSITARDCEAAIRRVARRQEALRSSFLPGKDGPLQMIRDTNEVSFQARELSAAESSAEAIEALALEIFHTPFDMVQGPLYRIVLLSRSADDHVLVFAIHHAIADGWTLGVFVQDLCAAYLQVRTGKGADLPSVPMTYPAWGTAERAFWSPAEIERRAPFWRSRLAGVRPLWDAPIAPGPLQRQVREIPSQLTTEIRELARRSGTTLFNTLLAAFQVSVGRWMGTDDVSVGSPVANRTRKSSHETMGYFAGVVPLRARLDPQLPFSEMLRSVHQSTVDSFAEARPFVELAKVLDEPNAPGYNPIFEVRFALQNHPVPDVALPGLSAKLRMRSTGTPRFHLGCEITEDDDALELVWLYRSPVLPTDALEKLDSLFLTVLTKACRSPESRCAELTH
jgi:hypothetical protein